MIRCGFTGHTYMDTQYRAYCSTQKPAADDTSVKSDVKYLQEISKTYFRTLSNDQLERIRAFASTNIDISGLPTSILHFLHKVFSAHAIPNSKRIMQRIFSEYRARLAQPEEGHPNDTVLNRYFAFCILRFQENMRRNERLHPDLEWMKLPSDVHEGIRKLAYPDDTGEKNPILAVKSTQSLDSEADAPFRRDTKAQSSPSASVAQIKKLTTELRFLNEHGGDKDQTLKVVRTLSCLASCIHGAMSEPTSKNTISQSGDVVYIHRGVDVICAVIERRFAGRIGQLHSFELISSLVIAGKTSSNSPAMREYTEYFLCMLSKEYTKENASELLYIIFRAFEVSRVLLLHQSPDFQQFARAAFRCCVQNEVFLSQEPLSQKTLIRMVLTCLGSNDKDNVATCMKIICLPPTLECIRDECGSLLAISLADLVCHKRFRSAGCAIIQAALIDRLHVALKERAGGDVRSASTLSSYLNIESLCSIVNTAIFFDGYAAHRTAWLEVRRLLMKAPDDFFSALTSTYLTVIVTFLSTRDAETTAADWRSLSKAFADRIMCPSLSLQTLAYVYSVSQKAFRPHNEGFRWNILKGILFRLRSLIHLTEWQDLSTEFDSNVFLSFSINRSGLVRVSMSMASVLHTKQIKQREYQFTVLCLSFLRRGIHRSFAPFAHDDGVVRGFNQHDREKAAYDAFGIDASQEKPRKLAIESLRKFDVVTAKRPPSAKECCKYIICYGQVMRAKNPIATTLQTCAHDKRYIRYAFERLWQERPFLTYMRTREMRDEFKEVFRIFGAHWAPKLWEFLECK